MNKETAKSSIRYEQHLAELAHRSFYEHPETQAEKIARHYTAHAILALHLLDMIDARRNVQFAEPTAMLENLDFAIEYCVNKIKTNHLHDFGTPIVFPPCGERSGLIEKEVK